MILIFYGLNFSRWDLREEIHTISYARSVTPGNSYYEGGYHARPVVIYMPTPQITPGQYLNCGKLSGIRFAVFQRSR